MVTITPVRAGTVCVLTVSGEVDLTSGPRLRAALDDVLDYPGDDDPGGPPPTGVVVDLTGVSFLGSAGLAVLVDAHEQASQRGIRLKIVIDGGGSAVARAFQAAAIHEHLDLRHSIGDALHDG
jgi:anti-sigma B factor antagonist